MFELLVRLFNLCISVGSCELALSLLLHTTRHPSFLSRLAYSWHGIQACPTSWAQNATGSTVLVMKHFTTLVAESAAEPHVTSETVPIVCK